MGAAHTATRPAVGSAVAGHRGGHSSIKPWPCSQASLTTAAAAVLTPLAPGNYGNIYSAPAGALNKYSSSFGVLGDVFQQILKYVPGEPSARSAPAAARHSLQPRRCKHMTAGTVEPPLMPPNLVYNATVRQDAFPTISRGFGARLPGKRPQALTRPSTPASPSPAR